MLTFYDWDNYLDDDGNACTLNWSEDTGYNIRPHLEAVRLAVVERCGVTPAYGGVVVPSSLTTAVPLGSLASYVARKADIQATISALIPMFANHTDHGGNWDGVTSYPAPAWTTGALMADIGATRLTQKTNGVRSCPWVKQQRLILERLIWTRRSGTIAYDSTQPATVVNAQVKEVHGISSWAGAVAAWPGASWGSAFAGETGAYSSQTSGYNIARYRATYRATNHYSPAAKIAMYDKFMNVNPSFYTYENNDYPYTEGTYYPIGTSGIIASATYEDVVTLGDFATVPVSVPWAGWRFELSQNNLIGIYQFNVTGGFIFQ